eukprot:1665717-Pleurochrysis_carterae.AAC.3
MSVVSGDGIGDPRRELAEIMARLESLAESAWAAVAAASAVRAYVLHAVGGVLLLAGCLYEPPTEWTAVSALLAAAPWADKLLRVLRGLVPDEISEVRACRALDLAERALAELPETLPLSAPNAPFLLAALTRRVLLLRAEAGFDTSVPIAEIVNDASSVAGRRASLKVTGAAAMPAQALEPAEPALAPHSGAALYNSSGLRTSAQALAERVLEERHGGGGWAVRPSCAAEAAYAAATTVEQGFLLRALATTRSARSLRALDISSNYLGARGLRQLCGAIRHSRVEMAALLVDGTMAGAADAGAAAETVAATPLVAVGGVAHVESMSAWSVAPAPATAAESELEGQQERG